MHGSVVLEKCFDRKCLCPVTEGVLENVDLRLTMRGGELLMFERKSPELLHEGRHGSQM